MLTVSGKVRPVILCVALMYATVSCSDEGLTPGPENGTLKLGFDVNQNGGRTSTEPSGVKAVFVTIESAGGQVVLEKKIDLISIASKYIIETLTLPEGHFRITRFLVLGADDEVLFLTPARPSESAFYVDRPLPLPFHVAADESTEISLEVIPVDNDDPSFYGYASIDFKIVEPCEKMSGKIDGEQWCGRGVYVIAYGSSIPLLELRGQNAQSMFGVSLRYTGAGNYNLAGTESGYYEYGKADAYNVVSGTLAITSTPTAADRKLSAVLNMIVISPTGEQVEIKDLHINQVNGSGY